MKVCDLLLDWRRRNWDARIGAVATIDGAVEKCVKAVVFLLGDRVVLVRMTLGAHHRQAEPGGGRSRDAVLHRFGSIFLVITAAFIIGLGIAVETGGDFLIEGGVGQEVTGELLNRKLIER